MEKGPEPWMTLHLLIIEHYRHNEKGPEQKNASGIWCKMHWNINAYLKRTVETFFFHGTEIYTTLW